MRYVAALAALCSALTIPVRAQQFRATWVDIFHSGMSNQDEVNTLVSCLVTGHYNAVIVQVLGYMDRNGTASHGAHWQSSILPWSTRVTPSFDPLAYLCTQAHAKGIQVHAWLGGSGGGPYRVSLAWPPTGNATLTNHPEWFMVPRANSEGGTVVPYTYTSGSSTYNYCLLDMGSPDVQNYLVGIVSELVTNYPIDGINWDDEIDGAEYTPLGIGFPACSTSVYPNSGLARYRRNTGYVGTPSATDAAYNDYRRRFKNELMARVQAEIQSVRTNVWHTCAPMAYGNAPSNCDFTQSTPYLYYSDWAGMLQNGWLDAAIPQVYRVESSSASSYNAWCDACYSCWQYSRKIFIGVSGSSNPKADIVKQLKYAYNDGLNGCATYSYTSPCTDGGDWWSYVAANLYTNTATVPTMPWRNPATATSGTMWGRVQDGDTSQYVDDATVTVTGGPTVKTDGNGYYVATLIRAVAGGTLYSTTASKSGAISQTIPNARVLPGSIVRYDFTLNASTPPSIVAQPQSQTVSQGADATFTVTATGTSPLYYQWQLCGTNILGGVNASSYTRTAVRPADAGPYSVIITNGYGMAASSNAMLMVTVPPPLSVVGDNSFGQCSPPAGLTNLIAVAAGAWHALALRTDGTVIAWGDDSRGQCDVPGTLQDTLAIAAGGYHSLAIRATGAVMSWGANDYGQAAVPAGLKGVIGIAAGTWHSVALRADGTVAVWGDNSLGQTNQPPGLTNVAAVAAGGSHTLALKANGTVVAWGENTDAEGNVVGQSVVPWDLTNVVAIAAGEYHSLAVKSDGTVVAWGDNWQSQCRVPPGLANVVAVAGGGAHSLALGADGAVTAWGADCCGQCDVLSSVFSASGIAAGNYHTVVLLEGTIPVPRLLNPSRKSGRFGVQAQTLYRKRYALECQSSLAAANWTALCTNAGNGALRVLADTNAFSAQQFYRMRQW